MNSTAGHTATSIRRLRHSIPGLLFLASVATGTVAGHQLGQTVALESATAEIEARVDRGEVFRLYYNNIWTEAQTATIQPGVWTTYRFAVPSRLTALRLDPADAPDAQVDIKSITVRAGGRVASIALTALPQWLQTDLAVTYDPTEATVRILTRQSNSYAMGTVDVDLASSANPVLRYYRLNPITLLWCVFLTGLGALALSITRREIPVALAVTAAAMASMAIGYLVGTLATAWPGAPADVSLTVGAMSFVGLSKAAELRALNLAAVAAAASALASGWLIQQRYPAMPTMTVARPLTRGDALVIGGVLLLFALGSVPAATDLQQHALAARHPDDFDSLSVLLWQYLQSNGSIPWRDYWFPYSGMYDTMAPLQPDVTIRWSHSLLLAGVLTVAGFLVAQRSRIACVALVAIWVYLSAMGLIVPTASERYFLSVSLILAAAVILNSPRVWPGLALGLWTFYVFQEEVSQAVYAAPGLLLLGGAALIRPPLQSSRAAKIRQLLYAAAMFAACLTIMLVSLARHEQLDQWWEFLTTVGVMSNYSSWPVDIASWFTAPDTVDQFLAFITLLLVVGGIIHAARSRLRELYHLVPLAIGLLSFMLLQKQVIRPGIEGQVLVIPLLGAALLAIQRLRGLPTSHRYGPWLAASAALIVSCFTLTVKSDRDRVGAYLDVTAGVLPDIEGTLSTDHWAQARAAYFSPASLSFGDIPGPEFATRTAALTHLAANENIFVLGNHSSIYMALAKPVAFYVGFYNQSPLLGQRRTMTWLDLHDPKVLFWDPTEKVVDSVPNPVRVPLLYNYAVAGFVPLGVIGPFEVLRRRAPSEAVAVDYWRERIGPALDLGYIPAASRALIEADPGGAHQMTYLVAHVADPVEGTSYAIDLSLAWRTFTVQFRGRSGVTDYPIALDRHPFAAASAEMGLAPRIESASVGVTSTIAPLRFAAERLY